MTEERIQASTTVNAGIETVFDVLADPSTHQEIDGTGWVRESLDGKTLAEPGQIFRMAMYHDNHPAKAYEMSNRIEILDRPHAIAWQPGQGPDDRGNMMPGAEVEFGGWVWRYDLEASGPGSTAVTLTYDWSNVPAPYRRDIPFPPFDPSHLDNSLKNLASLAEARR
ncbi:polyketide cyclase [Mycolicibacterium celeriflavum]|uniref:polyketide cyclase n=1 Tax=Mycolicibacterium celeriflavum TaxID=1249101 RepID=UPI0008019360|nr:polyketide cyclase [Mycolicibacterium celeriflavum]MCV7239180.1 polyketide cyclase [Mycolicibacterium celeriflavum]OBG17577.1 polyketide cyclase [Mycolicibacterium celeriflavum]ORA46900.1 polyketide cyclase [Mycolicibacterium celeriflavum]